jgi:hypothetical protein
VRSLRSVTIKNALELLRETMQDKNDRFRRPPLSAHMRDENVVFRGSIDGT